MKKATVVLMMLWAASAVQAGGSAQTPATPAASPAPASQYRATLDRYCVTCHNTRLRTAGLALDVADLTNVPAGAETWERVIRKLRVGSMPPAGMPRPDQPTIDAFVSTLEATLDQVAVAQPNPGRTPLHRFNRTEYRNAIRDLLDLDVDVSALLPPDSSSYGFDNISDTLKVNPLLLERYLGAGMRIAALAVGDPGIALETETFRPAPDLSQDRQIDGLPIGTQGGIRINYNFPLDAEYVFKGELMQTNAGGARGLEGQEQPYDFELSIDGERVHFVPIGGKADNDRSYASAGTAMQEANERMTARVAVKAGPHAVVFAFVRKPAAASQELLQPLKRASLHPLEGFGAPKLAKVTISGPYNGTAAGDTPSRRRIFMCRPAAPREDEACARRILTTLAQRAYSRQIGAAEIEPLLTFYRRARSEGGSFERGIQAALPRMLAGPEFIFRSHPVSTAPAAGAAYRISDWELASRLALFLWSSIPDETLLQLAAKGALRDAAVLEQQVRRMIADPRGQALVDNFAAQWLYVRNLKSAAPDLQEFRDFDDNLRQAFRREMELFFGSIVREDRSVLDLLDADYTFVDERLAKHYGIPNVYGPRFRRVTLPDESRRGLLGKGSILMVTSVATRTSPVLRGKWILSELLMTPPPPPPPDVDTNLPETKPGEAPKTLREQMQVHRANAVCATCHNVMDPLGFALENFDAVGRWREKDAGTPIDPSGSWNGIALDGPGALRRALLAKPDVLARTVTEKMMTYALARGVEAPDIPAVRKIVRDAARANYKLSSIVLGIVRSTPFQMRLKQEPS